MMLFAPRFGAHHTVASRRTEALMHKYNTVLPCGKPREMAKKAFSGAVVL
jgi:hypothetical protein